MKKILTLFVINFLYFSSINAQQVSDFLDAYAGDNAIPYIQPLADIFTANVHTGTREWSRIDTSFYIRIRGQAIYSWPSEKSKTFTGVTPENFEPQQFVKVPTIVGKNEAVSVAGVNETFYVFPTGYNVKILPFGTPQITVGGFLHSELSARFFALPLHKDFGDIQFWGIGARHDISHYFKNLPFNVVLGYFYHNMKLEEHVNTNHHLISAHIGKSGKWWSTELMLGYQTADMEANYSFNDGERIEEVHVELTNENPFIMELTVGAKFSIIGIHASASYADLLSASLGIGLYF
ncbi:MAG TPA: DUF6588 family protein [Saprospiraceae bacterium]|nr:DUF6588 family protein [Saprospiraceae bacterium]